MTGKKEASQPAFAKRAQGVAGLPMLLQEGLLGAGGRLLRLVLNGFYSVAGLLRFFAFLTLARVRNAQNLRTHAPGEWGILLGLDRCPEVKTLRRTLYRFAGCVGAIPAWQDALARQCMAADPAACATVAADGHDKVYAGRKGKLLSRCKRFKPGGGPVWQAFRADRENGRTRDRFSPAVRFQGPASAPCGGLAMLATLVERPDSVLLPARPYGTFYGVAVQLEAQPRPPSKTGSLPRCSVRSGLLTMSPARRSFMYWLPSSRFGVIAAA